MPFWDSIANIFRQAEASTPSAPTIHELIERSPEEVTDYERWERTAGSRRLLDWLAEQYAVFLSSGPQDEAMAFLNTNSSKGFVIYITKTNYTREEMTHFFDFLKAKVLTLNYRSAISDRRIFPRRDWVETQERHYLKPIVDLTNPPVNQGFGNIMIELELRNDVPHNLRLRATVYVDSMYRDAGNFGGLVDFLVSP